jgi:hypothetical protein
LQTSTSSRKRGADAKVQLPETTEPRAYSLSVVQHKAKFDAPKRYRDSDRVMSGAEVPLHVGGQCSSGSGAQDHSNDACLEIDEADFVTITTIQWLLGKMFESIFPHVSGREEG